MVDMSDLLKIVDFITVSNFVLDKKYYNGTILVVYIWFIANNYLILHLLPRIIY